MSVQRAKALLRNFREVVRQDMSIAHARLDPQIFEIQKELDEAALPQDQRSLYDQLLAVQQLANANGHYAAADWILQNGIRPIQQKTGGR